MPFRRRRSPRHGRRAAGPGRWDSARRSLANRSPARHARGAQVGPRRRRPGTAAGVSSPWNCSSACGTACSALRSTSCGAALTNSSTGVTKGGRRRASSAARCRRHVARALRRRARSRSHRRRPATAASTSSSRVRPQILMRVRARQGAGAQGSQSIAGGALGQAAWRHRSTGPTKYRPSGAKVGAAASRLRAASTSAIQPRRLRGPGPPPPGSP